ncbi:unnamed protein product (macronuclear) [Paramecium tetraurelia]|uniref:Cache domain-containing protein n=1 Tax=Paramecium tetraurelia TaxID=5888 RepID=A0D4S3_PARTE|nr:uncharacterized protein GSPATT00013487001 [Paramecium tetraurelia]CAK78040.1 unnamed protein product [Paramecium tetraurelia]|eukprot:XP_001445437.1 hypothetical protein (macronuclear) [Paramecium tetraurelia strain d4-2]
MIQIFLRCFRNLRMKLQVLIIILPILALTMLLVGLTSYIQSTVIFNLLENQSNHLLMYQEYKALSQVALELQTYIGYKHKFYISRLGHLNQLFSFIQQNGRDSNMNHLKSCLRLEDIQNNFIEFDLPQFCYFACGSNDKVSLPQENQLIKIFNQTTQLINQFTIALDATENSLIAMVDFSDTIYFAAYPHIYLNLQYNPLKRPWYISHMNGLKTHPENNYFFSPIFTNYVKNIYQMSITYSISGTSNSNIGIIMQNIELNDTNIKETPYNIIVSNENGEVVLQGIESIKKMIYIKDDVLFINDTNQTGFNDTDWQQIKKVASGEEIENRCNTYNANAFCLYNKFFQQFVLVNATRIKEGSFYLIIYSNITSQTILNQQLATINQNLQSQLQQSQYVIFFSGISLLFLSILIIHQMFLPLTDLMRTLFFYIKSTGNNINKEIFQLLNTQKKTRKNNIFSDLMQQFLRFEAKLNGSQQNKNKECLYFEQIEYQKQPQSELISPLNLSLNNISNDYLTMCKIKNIFDLLKLKLFNF